MDIKLREIATKAAGTYFIVNDNSAVETIAEVSKLRLMFISSEFGVVNTVVLFQQGDVASFRKVFGRSTRAMEKKGNYSLKAAEEALEGGALAVMNLRPFDAKLDKLSVTGLSATNKKTENREAPYTSLFNTNMLWTVTPKFMPKQLSEKHLLNIATIGTSDISVFFTVASDSDVAELTSEGAETIRNTSLEIDDYPALDPDMQLKKTFVKCYVFNNTFDPKTVGTNKYYGHLFDANGNLDLTKLDELCSISESGFNRSFVGSLIPNLKSETDSVLSIDQIINQSYAETGLVAYINDDVLEADNLDVIDFDGSSFYDEEGNILPNAAETMLSHIVPRAITKKFVQYPPLMTEVEPQSEQEIIFETEKLTDTEFVGVFEQGIRVGDQIKGANGSLVEVTGIEILEEDVPAVDPTKPKDKFPITVVSSANGEIVLTNKATGETVNSGDEVEEDTVLIAKFTPNQDIIFDNFLVNGESIAVNPAEIYVSQATEISVDSHYAQFTVTFEQPEHGTVTVSDALGTITSGDKIDKYTELEIAVEVEEGYELKDILANGISLGSESGVKGTVTSDLNIEVVIEPKKLKVTVEQNQNADITIKRGDVEVPAGSLVDYGTALTIEVTPHNYFKVTSVKINDEVFNESKIEMTATTDIAISAVVEQIMNEVVMNGTVNGTFNVTDAEGNTITSGSEVEQGTELMIVPQPSENYQVKSITVNGQPVVDNKFTLLEDSTIDVQFEIIKCTITKVAPEHGLFTVYNDASEEVESEGTINKGTTATIVCKPDAHYEIDKVTVNDAELEVEGENATFVVTELQNTIKVTFKTIIRKVTIVKNDHVEDIRLFTVDGETKTPVDIEKGIVDGTEVYIEAVPSEGYDISEILVGDVKLSETGIVEITSDVTITASAIAKQFPVTFNENFENGSIEVYKLISEVTRSSEPSRVKLNQGDKVEYGSVIEIDVYPNEHYKLQSLTVGCDSLAIDEEPYRYTVTKDIEISAAFALKTWSISFPNLVSNGTFELQDADGNKLTSPAEVTETKVYKIIATPDENYRIDILTIGGKPVEDVNNVTFTANAQIVCQFARKTATVNFTKTGEGNLIVSNNSVPLADGGSVNFGEDILITATPAEGYELKQILVNGAETSQTRITVAEDTYSIEAVFEKINYTVSWNEDENASVVVNKNNSTEEHVDNNSSVPYETPIELYVLPAEGYQSTIKVNGVDYDTYKSEHGDPEHPNVIIVKENIVFEIETTKKIVNYNVGLKNAGSGVETQELQIMKEDGSFEPLAQTSVPEGSVIKIVATPAEGYELSYKVDGQPLSEYAVGDKAAPEGVTDAFTVRDEAEIEVTAELKKQVVSWTEPLPQHVTEFRISSLDPETSQTEEVTNGGQVKYGSMLTITATPSDGYICIAKIGDKVIFDSSKGYNPSTVVNEDVMIDITEEVIQYTVSYDEQLPEHVTAFSLEKKQGDNFVEIANNVKVDHGAIIAIHELETEAGYKAKVKVDGETVYSPEEGITNEITITKDTVFVIEVSEETFIVELPLPSQMDKALEEVRFFTTPEETESYDLQDPLPYGSELYHPTAIFGNAYPDATATFYFNGQTLDEYAVGDKASSQPGGFKLIENVKVTITVENGEPRN